MTSLSASGAVDPPGDWEKSLREEFLTNQGNGCVGHVLVSETRRVRVWLLRLRPGERIGFHRHVLNYFWTAVTGGRAISHCHDGRVASVTYEVGETRHFSFGAGEFLVHDLENAGDTELVFTTVEFLDSANPSIPIPDHVRSERQCADRRHPVRT